MVYLQDKESEESALVDSKNKSFRRIFSPYTIRPGDILSINISTQDITQMNGQGREEFDNPQLTNRQHPYLSGYHVNELGDIDIPIIGKVALQGLTLIEAQDSIGRIASQYYSRPSVRAFLLNFNVSVLGEVLRPGRFPIYQTQISLFEVLALAGGLDDFADRKAIRIMRQIGEKTFIYHVDITDQKTVMTDKMFMKPNDIVMVRPMGRKKYAGKTVVWIISSLASIAVIIGIFARVF